VFLVVQRGPEIGRCYELSGADYTIGRGPDNDLVLDDGLVARYHAVIRQDGQRVVVVDLGGEHPVTVNDVPQEPGAPAKLQHRDVVGIGRCVFSYQQPRKAATQPVPTPTYSGEAQSTAIEAVVGQLFAITLRVWGSGHWPELVALDRTVLDLVESTPLSPPEPITGDLGKHRWTFRPLRAGTAMLSFQYRRPWTDEAPRGEESYHVVVH
jgi:predicted component of type VI protein secretion system